MSRTTLVIGPPGTGKTHYLMDEVAKALNQGIPPDKIAFLTFTKQAAQEAVSRAVSQFGLDRKEFKYFRTLHSLAYNHLGLKRSDVMTTRHFIEFGKAMGVQFSGHYDEETERAMVAGKIGDQLLGLYSLARSRSRNMEQEWELGGQYYEFERYVARDFDANLRAFKSYHGLLDFGDFLDHVHTPLDVDLFILDEAQDQTPQQWELAKRLASRAKKVLIAGDDDQAIFTWAGADVSRLLGMRGERLQLPVSYRLPKQVFNVVNGISSRIGTRFPKTWRSRDAEGSVKYLPYGMEDSVDIREGDWMLLCRQRSHLNRLERLAKQQGQTYVIDGHNILKSDVVQAVVFYEQLRSGKTLDLIQVEVIAKFIMDFRLPDALSSRVDYNDVPWPWHGKPDWMEALTLIDTDDLEWLRSVRRNGISLKDEPKVRISTIHGSKGAEADNVLLLTSVSRKIKTNGLLNPDDERRVWYVGSSRARQNLFMVGPELFC